MKPLIGIVIAAALAGCATPYAPRDFDFADVSNLQGITYGMVEIVDIHAFHEVIEHKIQPEPGERLLIRLDDGRAITLVEDGAQRFEPGQRVRILSSTSGTQVEHE